MELTALRRAIPEAIDAMGGDSRVSALGDDAWAIFRGSAIGYVALIGRGEDEGDPVVHASFPILRVPETGAEPLYKRLLELNHELGSLCSFSVDPRGKVWLGAARFAADLDESSLRELIAQLAGLADRYDGQLLAEFGSHLAVS
ncbi:MAG: T3SS (YopN, CesT) and YbjN peptide-binding chaperone 1 [Gemmatimonadales bacterium]